MMKIDTDIDIDFADRNKALSCFPNVPAMYIKNGEKQRHPSGVYVQDIPIDPFTGWSSFDYEKASEHGYVKLDILSNTVYEGVENENHLINLLNEEPDWELFQFETITRKLAQIRDHDWILKKFKPNSIEDLAIVLALVRPGKKHLINESDDVIRNEIWKPDDDGYVFKRAHAIAYAVSIVVQLNLLCEQLIK